MKRIYIKMKSLTSSSMGIELVSLKEEGEKGENISIFVSGGFAVCTGSISRIVYKTVNRLRYILFCNV